MPVAATSPILAYQDYDEIVFRGLEARRKNTNSNNCFSSACPYCKIRCETLTASWYWEFAFCRRCGWWSYVDADEFSLGATGGAHDWEKSRQAVLRKFAVEGTDTPIEELTKYLNKNHDRIRDVHPAKFEELVASIFRDVMGNIVEFCSYGRPDRGIDVICLNAHDGKRIGIQVKRYRRPIELNLIHQFCGALIDNALQSGVFVTSGHFRAGCYDVQRSIHAKADILIDLIDGRRFLEFLNVYSHSQPCAKPSPDELVSLATLKEISNKLGIPKPAGEDVW